MSKFLRAFRFSRNDDDDEEDDDENVDERNIIEIKLYGMR